MHTNSLFLFPLEIPDLPAVEQILQDGIESQDHGSQGMQIIVGHPNAHISVFLTEKLSTCYGIAITTTDPFTQAKLHNAEEQSGYAKP